MPGGAGGSTGTRSAALVPIREVWIVAAKGQGTWLVRGTANTASEKDAKLVALVLRFALVAWMRGQKLPDLGERLGPVTVMPEGSQVKLAGLTLTDEEIGPIFLSLVAGPRPQEGSAP